MSRGYGFGEGEGALILPFDIHETVSGTPDLNEDDHMDYAVGITGNNEAGDLADGKCLLGKVMGFSPDGLTVMVQVKGIVKDIPYAAGTLPAVGDMVQGSAENEVDIAVESTLTHRGLVLNVDATAVTCDILL